MWSFNRETTTRSQALYLIRHIWNFLVEVVYRGINVNFHSPRVLLLFCRGVSLLVLSGSTLQLHKVGRNFSVYVYGLGIWPSSHVATLLGYVRHVALVPYKISIRQGRRKTITNQEEVRSHLDNIINDFLTCCGFLACHLE